MTALAAQLPTLDELPDLPELPSFDAPAPDSIAHLPKPMRRAVVDTHIAQNRRNTPAVSQTSRATKRLSIEELNDLDEEDLKQRFEATQIDDRGPITRALDMIDLSRNTMVGLLGRVLTPTKYAELTGKGEKATLGQTRFNGSDLLEGLGVENRVIKALGGFGIDVAFDPLTYLGGAGIGARLLKTGGMTVDISRHGGKLVRAAVEAHDAGRAIDTATDAGRAVKELIDTMKIAPGKAAETVLGKVSKKASGPLKFLKNDQMLPSPLADLIGKTITPEMVGTQAEKEILAANKVFRAASKQHAPGVRLFQKPGEIVSMDRNIPAGSGLLHVPFMDFAVTVPGYTRKAREAATVAALAKDGYTSFKDARVDAMKGLAQQIDQHAANIMPGGANYDMLSPELYSKLVEDAKTAIRGDNQNGLVNQLHNLNEAIKADPLAKPADVVHAQNLFLTYNERLRQLAHQADAEAAAAGSDAKLFDGLSKGRDSLIPKFVAKERADLLTENAARRAKRKYAEWYTDDAVEAAVKERDSKRWTVQDTKKRMALSLFRGMAGFRHDVLTKLHDAGEAAVDSHRALRDAVDATETSLRAAHEGAHSKLIDEIESEVADAMGAYAHEWQAFANDPKKMDEIMLEFRDEALARRGLTEDALVLPPENYRAKALEHHGATEDVLSRPIKDVRGEAIDEALKDRGIFKDQIPTRAEINAAKNTDFTEEAARMHGFTPEELNATRADMRPSIRAKSLSDLGTDESMIAHLPFDAAGAEARAATAAAYEYEKNLDPKLFDILNTTPAQRAGRAAWIDAVHAQAEAAHKIAMTAKATVSNTMNSTVKGLRDAAAVVNGFNDTNLGSSLLSSVEGVARHLFGDGINSVVGEKTLRAIQGLDRYVTNTFGPMQGSLRNLIRNVHKSHDYAGNATTKAVIEDVANRMKGVVPPENMDEAADLVSLLIEMKNVPLNMIAADDRGAQALLAARHSGLLDKSKNPGVAEAIEALADEYKANGAAIWNGPAAEGYFPRVQTAEAARNTAHSKANQVISGGVDSIPDKSLAQRTIEHFEKPRSTLERRWIGADGVEHRFMDADRVFQTYTPIEIGAMTPAERAYVEAKRADIDAFDKLGVKEQSLVPAYHLTTPEINARVNEGMFPLLTLGPLNGKKFFETNVALAYANRMGAEERRRAVETLQKTLQPHAIDDLVLDKTYPNTKQGTTVDFRTKSGVLGKQYQDGGTEYRQLGNETYRQIRPNTDPAMNPAHALYKDSKIFKQWYPVWAADAIEDAAGIFAKHDPGPILGMLEEATKLWKTTTLLHPSWTINDVLGNLYFALNHLSPAELAKHLQFAARTTLANSRGDANAMHGITTTIRGSQPLTAHDVVTGGADMLGNHFAGDAISHLNAAGIAVEPNKFSVWNAGKKAARGDFSGAGQELRGVGGEIVDRAKAGVEADTMSGNLSTLAVPKGIKTLAKAGYTEGWVRRVWAPWAKANGMANDWIRTATYTALLDRGMDPTSAARFVNENLLDMSMNTAMDVKLRRLIPFYSWMKASGVYGTRQLLENPKFFTVAPHLKHALETAMNGDQNLPESARPSWLRDQLAIQFGTAPDTRKALTLTSSLPIEAALYAASPLTGWTGAQATASYLVNSLNPVLKAPLELGAGREFFTKRTIAPDAGDITPTEYVLGQVRPLKEFGIGQIRGGPVQRAFEQGAVSGVSRALLGGRLQPNDDERRLFNLQREMDDRATAIRKRIGVAEREGARAESVIQQAKLLRLYADGQKKGLKVPRWAEPRIEKASR